LHNKYFVIVNKTQHTREQMSDQDDITPSPVQQQQGFFQASRYAEEDGDVLENELVDFDLGSGQGNYYDYVKNKSKSFRADPQKLSLSQLFTQSLSDMTQGPQRLAKEAGDIWKSKRLQDMSEEADLEFRNALSDFHF
jgi:hypothetical protein